VSSRFNIDSKILVAVPSLPASNSSSARARVSGRKFLIGLKRVLETRGFIVEVNAFVFISPQYNKYKKYANLLWEFLIKQNIL
jgi:hypothetical protein